MAQTEFWQLTEFSSKLGQHYTTVNDWFNILEQRRIHYVTRAANKKRVYDELDLQIGEYIQRKRDSSWLLNAIFDELPNEIETRPFPDDFQHSSDNQLANFDILRARFSEEMRGAIDDQVGVMKEMIGAMLQEQQEKLQQLLPPPKDPVAERQQRITERITENRIVMKLELEALDEWEKKPIEERTIKAGLFRREEDAVKRERFIKTYVQERFEDRLKKEYDISEELP